MSQAEQGRSQIAAGVNGLIQLHALMAIQKALNEHVNTAPSGPAAPPLPAADGTEDIDIFVPILKLVEEKQEVTGVVLQPEVVDAQSDIISAEVIEKAAGDFLAGFNKTTKLGLMHKTFPKGAFQLRQSFIAPDNMVIAGKVVKKGSWIMVVKILAADVWKKVKEGGLAGFSIGGKAKVQKLESQM